MVRPRRRRRGWRPLAEGLDERCLLAGPGLTAAQIGTAYGLAGLTFGGHAASGSGQTIAVVDAYNDPNIAAELAVFDSANSLPAPPSLSVVGQDGTPALPATDAGWAQEVALDVEWAHALAPGASIVLVEANSTSTADLMAAVKTAAKIPGVTVISMSWGGPEGPFWKAYDAVFATPGITFVASSGDDGPGVGAQWPASSPNVVGVGGTTLLLAGGSYQSETVWGGSSGGYSSIVAEPSFQAGIQSSGFRSVPDVAFDANTDTGVEVYSIDPGNGQGTWLVAGGTSLGTPAWAGLIAIADQGRALNSLGTLSSSQTLTTLYSLPPSAFHTIGGGFNTQTGLGTPNGSALILGLVASSSSAPVSTPPASTPPASIPPVGSVPIIGLPVIVRPVSTVPVNRVPVITSPVASPPASDAPPQSIQAAITPPPASSPVDPRQAGARKKARKHTGPGRHPKVSHQRLLARSESPFARN
jgi:subtilase family serine protease